MSDVHFDFSGKNFVVVGASSGLGRQIAGELAEHMSWRSRAARKGLMNWSGHRR